MLDAKGPGCVVRLWATSGNPIGNVRFYIDGAEEPAINELAAGVPKQAGRPKAHTLRPGKSPMLECTVTADAPHAVRRLAVRLKAKDLEAATRSTVLSIQFDEEKTVWCPMGDFFGSGVGINPCRGWWRTVDKDGWMTCYWVIPWR